MKLNRLVLLLTLLIWAAPALAQNNLLGDIAAERAKYGPTLSSAEEAKLLNAVAWQHRSEGWGLLIKGAGNSCPIGQTFVSCDILVHAPSVTHWDVLQAADPNGAAIPQFNSAGPCVLSPSSGCEMSKFLAPMDPGTGPLPPVPPGPVPPPVPTLDLSPVISRLEALYAQQERMFTDNVNWRNQTTAQLQEIKNKPGAVESVVKNRTTYEIIGGLLAAYLAQR